MENETINIFNLQLSDNQHEIAYLQLPTYPKNSMKTSKSVRLFDLLGKYDGPDIVFDFDSKGVLVGIEIISDNFDEEE